MSLRPNLELKNNMKINWKNIMFKRKCMKLYIYIIESGVGQAITQELREWPPGIDL